MTARRAVTPRLPRPPRRRCSATVGSRRRPTAFHFYRCRWCCTEPHAVLSCPSWRLERAAFCGAAAAGSTATRFRYRSRAAHVSRTGRCFLATLPSGGCELLRSTTGCPRPPSLSTPWPRIRCAAVFAWTAALPPRAPSLLRPRLRCSIAYVGAALGTAARLPISPRAEPSWSSSTRMTCTPLLLAEWHPTTPRSLRSSGKRSCRSPCARLRRLKSCAPSSTWTTTSGGPTRGSDGGDLMGRAE